MPKKTRMKWPLRYQIMWPMTLLMLGVVIGLSVFNAFRAASQQRAMTEAQIRSIAQTLANSSFPLTDSVLSQMKGLAGTEFVLVGQGGEIRATTRSDWTTADLPIAEPVVRPAELRLYDSIRIADSGYFYAAIRVRPRDASSEGDLLSIYFSESLYQKQRRKAILPTILIGGLALVLVAAVASAIAARVSRPLVLLREQVGRIADGHLESMPLPANQDEIRELSIAVNRMVETLASYESTIRRTEQLRTLGQLGAAFAHQLRNSATGARMALDIHRGDCSNSDGCESLEVAIRQLVLMEKYIQRFLSLGTRQSRMLEPLNVVEVIENLLPLLGPSAKHAGVQLDVLLPDDGLYVSGERDGLEHLILNLLLNGIEAASAAGATRDESAPCVRAILRAEEKDRITLTIEDNGAGPPKAIAPTLFESFVTSKPDGVGLGLAIAKQVVSDHGGTISWSRESGITSFRVELPRTSTKDESSEANVGAHPNQGIHRVEVTRG